MFNVILIVIGCIGMLGSLIAGIIVFKKEEIFLYLKDYIKSSRDKKDLSISTAKAVSSSLKSVSKEIRKTEDHTYFQQSGELYDDNTELLNEGTELLCEGTEILNEDTEILDDDTTIVKSKHLKYEETTLPNEQNLSV